MSPDLTRARGVAGASFFLILAVLLYPALAVSAPGRVGDHFAVGTPYSGSHTASMLLPALAVYLLGPRWTFPLTLALITSLRFAYPLHVLREGSGITQVDEHWGVSFFAGFSFLGSWGLSAPHVAARDQVQSSPKRTLQAQHESEGKLHSLIESKDDLSSSLEPSGKRITASSALRRVAGNGMGIAPGHMPRISPQGFTPQKTGHGFGLHISALAATEMKGRLTCASPGPRQGATFTLELPQAGEEVRS